MSSNDDQTALAHRLLGVAQEVLASRVDDPAVAEKLALGEAAYWFRMMNKNSLSRHEAFGVSEADMSAAVITWQHIQHNNEVVAADLRTAFLETSKKRGFS